MNKLLAISLVALFAIGNLMAFDLDYTGTIRARGGITLNSKFNDDASTTSWKSQRLRLIMTGEAENGIKFVTRFRLTDGDGSKTSETYSNPKTANGDDVLGKNEFNLDRAYMTIPDAFLGFTVTAGLMPFYAQNGLILDANKPGFYFSNTLENISIGGADFGDISIGLGGFTASTGSSTSDDSHAWIIHASMKDVGPGTLGLDILGQLNKTIDTLHEKAKFVWISPWYSMNINNFSVVVNPVLLKGCYCRRDNAASTVKSVDGEVYALSLKPSYSITSTRTVISGDFVYISGTTNPDEKLSWKNLGSFYCSGLEYFGYAGELDGGASSDLAIGNSVNEHGLMSFILKADQPLGNSPFTAHLAVGYAMSAEDEEYTKDGKTEKDNVYGTEIDASIRWAVKDNVTWKFVAGYVIPGDAMNGVDGYSSDENVTLFGSYLEYAF